ncbi:hypothetical protein E4P82_17975 [Candidatus Competibacter phosphatis]|uniref:Uncharacterized protein n=1 Tax=Candidatus Competibacter phosphatis TaxID=221280 RepID=A0ABX1TSJ4_9GAMM|nr:hypothetical protein [Candidatus Competibacter phosphatis]NMQ20910.1 hypothetical protein [Candidatus Competibacter phosphatis]
MKSKRLGLIIFEIEKRERGSAYVLQKSCLENYYHPKAFERTYGLASESFPTIASDDNAKELIKKYKKNHGVTINVKEKNNFDVFSKMTKKEWEEVVEPQLIRFLRSIVT